MSVFQFQKAEVFESLVQWIREDDLINCITGFIKMNSGKVLYKGKEISNRAPNQIANLASQELFRS